MLTFGSVCSGIEAASVAWDPLGFRALWFAEIEPFPSAVLAHRWPQVTNHGDMTKLAARILAGEIEAPDILVGGTPCQSFSVAGLGNSLEDPRGQLALAFCQLANAIDTVRRARGAPECIVVWENVPGVLSTKDNAFGCILAGLAGEVVPLEPPGGAWENAGVVFGPARTVAWRILDAQYFGVAQRRRRVFAVASARKGFDPAGVLFESKGLRRDSPPSRDAGEGVAGTLTRSAGERGAEDPERGQLVAGTIAGGGRRRGGYSSDDVPSVAVRGPGPERVECADIAPCLQSNGKAAGSATNQDAKNGALVTVFGGNNTGGAIDVAPALNAKGGSGRMDFESEALCVTGDITHALKAEGADGSEDGTGRGTPIITQLIPFDTTNITSKANRSRCEPGDPMHTLSKGMHPPAVAFAIQAGALRENPASGPDGVGVQADVAYTMEARAEVQAIAVHGTQDPGIAHAHAHALGRNNGAENAIFQGSAAVRRLTPRECERLQGFPDDYTLIPWRTWQTAQRKGVSYEALLAEQGMRLREPAGEDCPDGPRYKSLGNSMATPVMRWIGERVTKELMP